MFQTTNQLIIVTNKLLPGMHRLLRIAASRKSREKGSETQFCTIKSHVMWLNTMEMGKSTISMGKWWDMY